MKFLLMLPVLALMLTVVCGCSRIDTSTAEKRRDSVIRVMEKLEDDDFLEFIAAIQVLYYKYEGNLDERLHRLSASGVVELAREADAQAVTDAIERYRRDMEREKISVTEFRNRIIESLRKVPDGERQ